MTESGARLRDAIDSVYSMRATEIARGRDTVDPGTRSVYGDDCGSLPGPVVAASLGCAHLTAAANLTAGETVLDLGCGGGIDVLLAARSVGETGFVFGLDASEEMLKVAEQGRRAAGIRNVRWLKARFSAIPLSAGSVDVVVANCALSLVRDKAGVMREAARVLSPGGRMLLGDFATVRQLDPDVKRFVDVTTGCVGGTVPIERYAELMRIAGFVEIDAEVVRWMGPRDLEVMAASAVEQPRGASADVLASAAGSLGSVLLCGTKPQ